MSPVNNILILDDEETRIAQFRGAISKLGSNFDVHFWREAPKMVAECGPLLSNCCLISLDHDLNSADGGSQDPGTGMDVARFLAELRPACPIIIHTSNNDARWSMHNEFRFANMNAEIVGPIGENWIIESWLPRALTLLT
jgi:FixJ family two-component response regulator